MYKEYIPLSSKNDSSSYIPEELLEAQILAVRKIPKEISKDFDLWVASKLGLSKETLWDVFSSEQIDSIGLSIYNFELNKNFIIADETGIGKGRILGGICLYAWNTGLKVLFFTEREHLISEFWKDLTDIKALDKVVNPIIFHSTSKVYDQEGKIALKGTSKQVKSIEESGFSPDTNLVMTNYSQISLKQHKKTKTEPLVNYSKDAILILDESHNGCGDSNTKKLLLKLTETSKSIVFSSATFIKDETQLELYQGSFEIDEITLDLFKKLLKNDNKGYLRKIFTYELTKNLQFWRREHAPLNIGWNTVLCKNEKEISDHIQEYSEIINGLFKIVNDVNGTSSEYAQILTSAWFELGATINRLSRNLLLVMKINDLVDAVKKSISENHKAVVVIDSTLASMVKKIKANETEDDDSEDDYVLSFSDAIKFVINEVLGEYIERGDVPSDLYLAYQGLINKCSNFSSLSISPLDTIKQKLSQDGIKCGEISGRTFKINEDGKIEKLEKEPKTKTVKLFNSGELDVMLITRAGASGISLHASAAFKDQRVRDLYELEITNRPTYRLQFIGRVNRKNQVAQPRFFTVVTKLPFEQRILNIEQRKLKKLQSHISGDDEKHDHENIVDFYTKHTDLCVKEFLQHHPHLAYQMGINIKTPKDDLYYIDSILKRCIVLSNVQQDALYDYLIACVEVNTLINSRKNVPEHIETSYIKTFWHRLDNTQKQRFKEMFSVTPELSINQFIFPWVGLMKTSGTYRTKLQLAYNLKNELEKNIFEFNEKNKQKLTNVLHTWQNKNKYHQDFYKNDVYPLIMGLGIGKCVKLKTEDGKIYGYINNIIFPLVPNAHLYNNLIVIHIKVINPHLHESLSYSNTDYYISLEELIELEHVEYTNSPIDWAQFERPEKVLKRDSYCFVGHPIYVQFLKSAYGFGDLEYYKFHEKNQMCLVIPPYLDEHQILSLKKPIYRANSIMEGLIARKFKKLTTGWQDETIVKPIFKLEPTSGGYNFMVAQEVNRNFDIIDFPLRKRIGNNSGRLNGYYIHHIPYKQIRGLLWALEQKNVIWFIDN